MDGAAPGGPKSHRVDSLKKLPSLALSELDAEHHDGEDDIVVPLHVAPDGGWGWAVALASFFTNMIVDGVCYTFSVIFNELLEHFGAGQGKTALVGALVPGTYLIVGPLVGALANKFGCRVVTIVGSLIAGSAFVVSAFSTSINMMLLTYGVMGGVGFGLMYLPSIVMVGHYFDKKRALATGIAVCGSGTGTFVFAPLGTFLVSKYGWKGANVIIGAIIFHGVVFGAIFRPLDSERPTRPPSNEAGGRSAVGEALPRSTIIERIIEEKRRGRTPSFDSGAPQSVNIQVLRIAGSVDNLGGSKASLRIRRGLGVGGGLGASQQSINQLRKDMASPFARKDALYTGSVQNLAEYKTAQDHEAFVASMTAIPKVDENASKCTRLFNVTMDMFKFSLLKSLTFIVVCASGVFVFVGLYTPFVYVSAKATAEMGVTREDAARILTILGICSTVSRVIVGAVADRRWIDLLIIHNISAILAGIATAFVSVINNYVLLCVYAGFFGVNIACFIALRSIVIVELLGIEKLNNAFGLTSLFQGIAVLIGSPLSGALVDITGNFIAPFVVFGSLIAMGGVVCLPVRRIAQWENAKQKERVQGYEKVKAIDL